MSALTIIEWTGEEPFTAEENQRNLDDAEAHAGPEYRNALRFFINENGNKTVTRRWPSLQSAQPWIDHVTPWGPVSTQVIDEQ